MNYFNHLIAMPIRLIPTLLLGFLAACGGGGGGGLDPLLGSPGAGIAPTITATSPANTLPVVTGVASNSRVTATFSKFMASATINTTSFSLSCPGGSRISAMVGYDIATRVATLVPNAPLPPSTLCVATVTTAAKDNMGFAMASNYVWSFMTAALPAPVAPTVILTVPAASATNVATNSRVFATFSKPMAPATLTPASFSLACAGSPTVTATVAYAATTQIATLAPVSALPANAVCVATVSTAVQDTIGMAMTSSYVWSFTTSATADNTAPTVTAVNPTVGAVNICLTKLVTATFSEPINLATLNTSTFGVTNNGMSVLGTVSYDSTTNVATFTPTDIAGFEGSKTFVATIKSGASGVQDVAGNPLLVDRVWSFTTGTQPCVSPIALGTAASFGAFGGAAGVTNRGLNTIVNGNMGTTAACSLITGFHDALNSYTETPLDAGLVTGNINCGLPAPGTLITMAIATQALNDAISAYNVLAAFPPGSDPGAGELGGLVLPAAVYTSAGGTFKVTTANLTLDAQGDSNAVWVFQSASALTVGLSATPRTVFLINGAQAKNVFWQVGSAARIENGSTMVGTIIAPAGVTISTAGQTILTTLTGRAIGLTASVTMVNTIIVAP